MPATMAKRKPVVMKVILFTLIYLLVVPLTDAGLTFADPDNVSLLTADWSSGGPANIIAVSPSDPGTVYAGTVRGVYKSINGGSNWFLAGLEGVDFKVIRVSSTDGDIVYVGACTANGFYKSTNGGSSWSPEAISGWTPAAPNHGSSTPEQTTAACEVPPFHPWLSLKTRSTSRPTPSAAVRSL